MWEGRRISAAGKATRIYFLAMAGIAKDVPNNCPATNSFSMHPPGLSVVVGIHGRIHVVKFVAVENPVGRIDVWGAVEKNVHRQRHDHDGNQPQQRARESRRGNQAEHAPEVKLRWIYKLAEKKRNGMVSPVRLRSRTRLTPHKHLRLLAQPPRRYQDTPTMCFRKDFLKPGYLAWRNKIPHPSSHRKDLVIIDQRRGTRRVVQSLPCTRKRAPRAILINDRRGGNDTPSEKKVKISAASMASQ